jgi:hypothetical protein
MTLSGKTARSAARRVLISLRRSLALAFVDSYQPM